MRQLFIQVIALIGALLLIGSGGLLHGVMTQRWGGSGDATPFVSRFASLPEQAGPWRLQDSAELSQSVLETLQCRGYVARTYVDENTGEIVNVAVLMGPSGPIAVHTPEICYSSREYSIEQASHPVSLQGADGVSDRLWNLTLRSRDLNANRLRVYYGWTTDGVWDATKNPRFAYGGQNWLFKLQVATQVSHLEADDGRDPCHRFLQHFNPVLRQHLFATATVPRRHSTKDHQD